MGGNQSNVPAPPPGFPYCCITFRIYDKIKILHADPQTLSVIRSGIQQVWPSAIQNERHDMGAYEFKFCGNPFSKNTSKEEAICIKRVSCQILSNLRSQGWTPTISSDLSRTQDLTTWFLERGTPPVDPTAGIVCLSMSSQDKLQLVNAPQFLAPVLLDAATKAYGFGVQDQRWVNQDYEVKLNGYPWYTASFEEGVHARRALLQIIRNFDANRFRFYTTANLKGTADCIFFQQDMEMTPGETKYMMLSLNASDRIRLIDAPADVISVVGDCISKYWSLGLQDQKDFTAQYSCYEFKLSGYPWNSAGFEAVSSRLLITVILQALVSKGWAVVSGLDISRRVNDKAVFVLRSCPPCSLPHFCISPNDTDKIRLVNAPQDVVAVVADIVRNSWPYGVQREGPSSGCYEIKLNGQPWSAFAGNDYAHARHLMCLLLQQLANRGWRVICSADVSAKYVHQQNGPDYPIDVHSWFFARTGAPSAGDPLQPNAPNLPTYNQAVWPNKA